ncbi:MAG: carbon-nitrogen hydrolase family protein [Desulfovibrio sp.]|uniref:carbon-nitrogen hydrolase family protein n=1 Tax=Desulfovibrio sp. 7SRBS1 TaxID=3378064 RepID=UPI003B3D11B4
MKFIFVMAQVHSLGDPEQNLEIARDVVSEAKDAFRADLVLFPEDFMSRFPRGTKRETRLSTAQSIDGPFVAGMKNVARENDMWLVFGMNEIVEDPQDERIYNTTVILDNHGELVGTYRKTHLYDAFGHKESANKKPGEALFVPIETPFGKLGLFVCYEVRFPEVARYQALHGAEIILMPTAWVRGDLKSQQFLSLISARAIENAVYMLACNQINEANMGESVAVDPMGVVIASGGEVPQLIPCHLDTDRVQEVRKKMPSYLNRRPDLYN